MRNFDSLRRLKGLMLGASLALVTAGLGETVSARMERSGSLASERSGTRAASSQPGSSPSTSSSTSPETHRPVPLRLVSPDSAPVGQDDRLWANPSDRAALIAAIDHSLTYLQTEAAVEVYRAYPIADFTLARVRRSLERFRELVLTSRSPAALQEALQREFAFYESVGTNGQGDVHFTGYFEPIHQASLRPTAEFRYPIYAMPPDLKQWPTPHPTRAQLEGSNGLEGPQGRLRGLEIAWLRDRLEAYLVQVQGSARLQLPDGSTLSIGYAGRTDYPYVSIGRELVEAGKIAASELTLDAVTGYFKQHPAELDSYLPRNNRFVFFRETSGSPAIGSLRVPVTAGRSIATDKSLMPPGALALIQADLPTQTGTTRPITRFVLDQDTGGAIQGAGRVDLFVGTGVAAGEQAGLINHDGQLYYLLLKN